MDSQGFPVLVFLLDLLLEVVQQVQFFEHVEEGLLAELLQVEVVRLGVVADAGVDGWLVEVSE